MVHTKVVSYARMYVCIYHSNVFESLYIHAKNLNYSTNSPAGNCIAIAVIYSIALKCKVCSCVRIYVL